MVRFSSVSYSYGPNIYSDKLLNEQVVINCQYSVAQMCTHEYALVCILGLPFIDDIMSYNSLTTLYLTI